MSGACEHCTLRDLRRLWDLFTSIDSDNVADTHATDHAHADSPNAGHTQSDVVHAQAIDPNPILDHTNKEDGCTDSRRLPQEPLWCCLTMQGLV